MKLHLFSLLCTIACIATVQGQITTINGEISNFKSDTVKLVLQRNVIARHSGTYSISVINGKFFDTLHLTQPTYFYTNDGSNYVSGLLEPGDELTISYNADDIKTSLKVTGRGSKKIAFVNTLAQLKLYRRLEEQLPAAMATKYPFDYLFDYADSVDAAMIRKLDSIKSFMKIESYNLLRADIKATVMGNKYRSVGLVHHESVSATLKTRKNELTPKSEQYLQNILHFDKAMFYSSSYLTEVYNILSIDYDGMQLSNEIDANIVKKYDYLLSRLPSTMVIPVSTLFLSHDLDNVRQPAGIEGIRTVIQRTYRNQKDSVLKKYIENRFNDVISFKKGMDAPDFVLQNENGDKITLSSFKGKVVYLDFWYAACGPCHVLFETLKPIKKSYSNGNNVVFLCVSIDSKEVWKNAIKKFAVEGYHVFTENKRESHPVISDYKVAGYPTTYLIDGNGKIFTANPSMNPIELQKQIADALTITSN